MATKNGSGSQTSNNVLVMSLFQMGIPVNGKNLFPSNIKGLPTWYTIRASKDGYTARKALTEIVVAYNDSTATEDVANLPPGGVCITTDKIARVIKQREDISYYEIPVAKLMRQTEVPSAFRKLVENMTYVGAVAQLFDIPLDLIYDVLLANFKGKAKPALMNHDVVKLAYDWTADNLVKTDPYRFERHGWHAGQNHDDGQRCRRVGRGIRRRQRRVMVSDYAVDKFRRWHHRLPPFAPD